MKARNATVFSVLIIVALSTGLAHSYSRAASASQFTSTDSSILNAFSATASAKQDGGNVTLLVAKLNIALNLTEEAQTLNASNPSESTLLLQNATNIAQQVSSEAITVGSAGASAQQLLTDESIGGAVATVIVAVLIYVFGGQIYRTFWFYLYRSYTVKRTGGVGKNNG